MTRGVQVTGLRLTGFKSFVEATDIPVGPGLTAVVGPNGCGKSNVVEALRWAMGESSAKRMRGSEMDDVIFAGTDQRPKRNVAEVAIQLDNAARQAPAQFNDASELEVVRRITRGQGSEFRVNGRTVRARDVQLLFADVATGAQSPAIVEQGRVGALINAKPSDRRHLLEDAAGVAGLHTRRHEAELRLRAAEGNLQRVDDQLGELAGQQEGLQRQAEQAQKYRRLAESIRVTEAQLLYLQWQAAEAEARDARATFQAQDTAVGEALSRVNQATTDSTNAEAALPDLRQRESEAAAALQRLTLERDSLDKEAERVAADQRQAEQRLTQIDQDLERERGLSREAAEALQALDEEEARLKAESAGEADGIVRAEQAAEEVEGEVERLESELTRLTEAAASAEAAAAAAEKAATQAQETVDKRRAARDRAEADLARARDKDVDPAQLEAAEQAVSAAESRVGEAERSQAAAEDRRGQAESALAEAEAARAEAQNELDRLAAEIDALAAVCEAEAASSEAPVLDSLSVAAGYEAALGAALGDDLEAPADSDAPRAWQTALESDGRDPALPDEAGALRAQVSAPAVLQRRLAQIGVVADAATAERLQPGLAPGQRLVTGDGGLWRWDGLVVQPGAPSPAAHRLEQRNRLARLRDSYAEARARRDPLAEWARAATDERDAARNAEKEAGEDVKAAYRELDQARQERDRLSRQRQEAASAVSAAEAARDRAQEELAAAQAALEQAQKDQAAAADGRAERAQANQLRQDLDSARERLTQRRNHVDRLKREAQGRRKRLAAIEQERADWHARVGGADKRLAEMEKRRRESQAELERLAARPDEIAQQRSTLEDKIAQAETHRQRVADELAEAETRARESREALKAAEEALADAREARAHAEGRVREADRAKTALTERIAERLACRPEEIPENGGFSPDEIDRDRQQLENRLAKLVRERDNLGPVNLRAEAELESLQERIDATRSERAELEEAIARLRQGIDELNDEARTRLREAFDRVQANFQRLFQVLFGGGQAHLSLTDSEDPLGAGLEIYASPPGKRLQVMSLLSGGERALAALALLFAVFETNPAPICVLDEVDAPLDDVNVDRFCRLVEDTAERTGTRFILVTHHRLTMSRADRLFGVTMTERGVSQVVAVDLEKAAAMRDSA